MVFEYFPADIFGQAGKEVRIWRCTRVRVICGRIPPIVTATSGPNVDEICLGQCAPGAGAFRMSSSLGQECFAFCGRTGAQRLGAERAIFTRGLRQERLRCLSVLLCFIVRQYLSSELRWKFVKDGWIELRLGWKQ